MNPRKEAEDGHQVLYIIDRHDWALGIVARELVDSLPEGWRGDAVSVSEINAAPLRAWRRSRSSDVVHFLAPYMALAYPWLALGRRAVVSLTNATTFYKQLIQLRFEIFVAISEITARQARQRGLKVNHVCRHGGARKLMDVGRERLADIRGGKPPVPVIGYIGKKSSDSFGSKGLDILVATVTRLAADHVPFKLLLCGEGWKTLCEDLRSKGIDVDNMGFVSDTRLFYNSIDIVLVTSRFDGGPLALVEGAVSGLPIVTTRVGLAPEIVIPGENGFICEVENADCLAKALSRLCKDENERYKMGCRSAEIGLAHWGWAHDYSRVKDLYAEASLSPAYSPGISVLPSVARSLWAWFGS